MRKNINYKLIRTIFLCGVVFFQSCKKDNSSNDTIEPAIGEYDRAAMLSNYVDAYILPAYTAYQSENDVLNSKVNDFTGSPSVANLQALKTQWETTLLVWQDVAFLEFGPAEYIALRGQTNVYPVDTTLILANIESGDYNLAASSNFDAKGFQAIDYLLNGVNASEQEVVDFFTNTSNAKTYLQDVVTELKTNATYVFDTWNNTYGSDFKNNNSSNAVGSSVSDMLNAMVQHYETYIRKGKIGLPAGVFNGFSEQAMPGHVEALYYGQSLIFAYRAVTSFQKFVNGDAYDGSTNGEGLDDYLAFVNATSNGQDLEVLIENQLEQIKTDIQSINDPLSDEVENNQQAVKSVYQTMQELVPFLKVETTNALGVQITYQDNDGD